MVLKIKLHDGATVVMIYMYIYMLWADVWG